MTKAITKEKGEREVIFTFNGIKFYADSIYRVKNKEDLDAPKAFQELGARKFPSKGISETFMMPFNEPSNIYDAGFSETSPCFRALDATESSKEAKLREKNILIPYLKAVGSDADAKKIHSNFEFWESKARLFTINHKTILNTADPIDRLKLYAAVMSLTVAIEEDQKNPKYFNTPYLISDTTGKSQSKNENVIKRGKAYSKFLGLIDSDRNLLVSILKYMNMRVSENPQEDALIILAETQLNPDPVKINNFLSLYEKASDVTFREELEIYRKINGNSKIKPTKNSVGKYTIDNQELGADLKAVARNLAMLEEFDEIKQSILLS
jgi:hypothetical protein